MNISSKYFFSIVFVLFFLLINTSHVFATGVASVIRGDSATITWNIANSITPGCSPSTVYPDLRSSTPGNIDTVWYDWVNTNTSSNSGSKPLGPVKSAPGIYRFSCTNYASTPNPTDYTDLIVRPEEPTFSATCSQQVNGTYNIALTWNAVTGGTNYPVRIAGPSAATNVGVVTSTNGAVITSSVGGGAVGDAAPTGTSYTFTGVPTAGTYTYWGNSWSSAVSSASPLPADAFSEYTPRAVTCVANQTPNAPTIGGPTTGTAGVSYNYTFTATDPDSNTIKYEIDWDNNSTVDQTLPASGYDPSGTTETQANTWASAGAKTFQARTVDSGGATSAWTTYTVTISVPNYTITATAGSGGTIAPTGSTLVASGASQTFTIATSTGYSVNTITVDGSAVSNAVSTYTFSNVTADHTIAIAFTAKPDLIASAITPTSAYVGQAKSFTSTITNQGAASVPSPSFSNFFQVSSSTNGGGPNIYDLPLVVAINTTGMAVGSTKTLTQSYTFPTIGTYSMRACADKSSSGNAGTKSESDESNNCGPWTDITVTAVPTYTITATAGAGGSISPTGVTSVTSGQSQTFTITTNAGYRISALTVDSVVVASAATYTFSNVTANHTIDVTFVAAPDLTASALTPTSATAGVASTFSSTITNIGGAAVSGGSFNNFFQVSSSSSGGGPNIYDLTSSSMSNSPALGINGTKTATQTFTFPTVGTYSMRVCADALNRAGFGTITESDEGNNCGAWTDITVNAAPVPVNGACSASHFSCTAGSSASNVTNSGSYSWDCNGLNGGTNATCSETPTVSVNVTTPINIDQGSAASVSYTVTPSTGTASCALYNWDSSSNLSGTSTGLTGANTFSIPSANTLAASASPYGYNVKCLLTATPAVGATSGSVSLYVNGCSLNGTPVPNGTSITAYDTSYANVCSGSWNTGGHSETRTCSGTTLSDPSGTGNFTNTTCTSVTMSVSATTPVNSPYGSAATINYTVTPSTGTASCALYDYANSPVTATTTGITSGAHSFAVPSASTLARGSYGYSVKCSSDLASSIGATSGNVTLNITGCTLDGTSVADGGSITAYDTTTASSCAAHSETRTCSTNTLSDPSGTGNFTNASCTDVSVTVSAPTPVSSVAGNSVNLSYTVTPSTGTASCALYDWNSANNLSGTTTGLTGAQTVAIPGSGSLAVGSYGYNVKCLLTSIPTVGASSNDITLNVNAYTAPDLTAGATWPSTNTVTGSLRIYYGTVSNIGTSNTQSTGFYNMFQFNDGTQGTGPNTTYQSLGQMGLVTAGGSGTANGFKSFATAGTWSMRLCTDLNSPTDSPGLVAELNENNNCGAWTDIVVAAASSCTLDGATIPSGTATSTYDTRTTAYPDLCTSGSHKINRTCTNGVLSGSSNYQYLTCTSARSNLTAGAVSPTSASISTPTTFSATISNIGATTSVSGFNNFIQVASTSDGTGTSYSLPYTAMGALAAGGTGITSQSYTFTSAGTYSMRACADKNNAASAGTIAEGNGLGTAENDNCGAWTAISVSAATCGNGATNPPTCSTNNIVASSGANGTVTPTGTTAVPYGTSQVYTITPSSGYSLATLTVDSVVVANAATYTFSNVTAAHTISATFSFNPQPDLTAGAVSPTTATAGSAATFSSTITNTGGLTTGAAFNNFIQVSTASNGGGTVTDLASTNMSTLAAGGTAVTSQSYTFPAAGTYSMRACADKSSSGNAGTITESNAGGTGEANNCGAWTDITVSAAPVPVVQTATVTGNNTPSGNITFSCGNSTGWQVTNSDTGVTIMSGTYPPTVDPTTVAVSVSGNYQVKCTNGGATDQTTLLYDSTPAVSDSVSLIVNQTSIRSGSSTSLTWSVANPVVACVLTASPVCTGGACTSPRDDARIAAASALTTTLSSGSTDINDPYGASRLMTTAIRTKVSGTKALGKKTVSLQYTTDFQLNCGGTATQKVRVNVTNDNEG